MVLDSVVFQLQMREIAVTHVFFLYDSTSRIESEGLRFLNNHCSYTSMLCAANLPDTFWVEAVLTAVILKNRRPTKAVKDKKPYENFIGEIPDVSNLRVFGCTAYMHIPKEKRQKGDQKSTKYISIGFSICHKAYILWNPQKRMVHEARCDFKGKRF